MHRRCMLGHGSPFCGDGLLHDPTGTATHVHFEVALLLTTAVLQDCGTSIEAIETHESERNI